MYVYVVQYKRNGNSDPVGVYGSWEKAEEEADSHAASVFGITNVRGRQWMGDDPDMLIVAYGSLERPFIVNYTISRFTLDAEAKRPIATAPS